MKTQINAILFINSIANTAEGGFRWQDDSPVDYENWANNQPNNPLLQRCVRMYPNIYGQWKDDVCIFASNYVCMMPQCEFILQKSCCKVYISIAFTQCLNVGNIETCILLYTFQSVGHKMMLF